MDHISSSAATTCTDLAAALCTLGIPRHPERPLEVLVGDADRVAFYFVGDSPCGIYHADSMIRAWEDRIWQNARPRHPLTYMRCALRNRSVLLDYAKSSTPCGIVSRNAGEHLQVVRIEAGHTAPPPPLATGRADAPANDSLRTDNLELASALLACGIPLWRPLPILRQAGRLIFFFAAASPDGKFQAAPLMLAWQQADWYLLHPEHPVAYIHCAMLNRRALLDEISGHPTTVCIMQASGMPAFLSLNAPPALEKSFLAELNAN